jgi:serine/threonine protein kinase/tetratricopeptide (TPR) repeat protein
MPGLNCVSDADLRAFLLGNLPERVGQAVCRHLESCGACEEALRRLDSVSDPLIAGLRQACRPGDPTAAQSTAEVGSQESGVRSQESGVRNQASGIRRQGTEPAPVNLGPVSPDAGPWPRALGGYTLLAELGRGGMGVVYRARQEHPAREVALKVLLAGAHAGPESRARLLAEADALARLRHPGIVQVYEVGEAEGLPFLALEYVDGGSLAQRLTGRPQPPRQAAQLVETLARAVHYAHQQGVVHRDLKPLNILLQTKSEIPSTKSEIRNPKSEKEVGAVSDWGFRIADFEPKVTDFGLAKQERRDLTATGAVLGTPSYMAPEQAAGINRAVGPAADVYALGAILYELLTGRPPFCGATALDTLEQVRSHEPVAPSQLQPGLPRDLCTVCLKCLEKEPRKRYASAQELTDDLGRFLAHRPIRARPSRLPEHAWRWCRRNPLVAGLLTAVALLLLTAVVGLIIGVVLLGQKQEEILAQRDTATKAAEAEGRAKRVAQRRLGQIEKANAVLGSIFHDLHPQAEKRGGPGLREQLGERLKQAAAHLDAEAVGDPRTAARVQGQLGSTLIALGYAKEAIALLRKVRATQQTLLGSNHPETLQTMHDLAGAYEEAGERGKAFTLLKQVLARRKAKLGADDPSTLQTMDALAGMYQEAGRWDRGVPLYERVLAQHRVRLGPDHSQTLRTMSNLALAYQEAGRLKECLALSQQVLARRKVTLGSDHADTLTSMVNLAGAYWDSGQRTKTVPLLEQTLEKAMTKLGPGHPFTLIVMGNLALAYGGVGKLDKAIRLLQQVLEKQKASLGPDHPETLAVMNNLATAYQDARQVDKALPLFQETWARRKAKLGPDNPETLLTMNNVGLAYQAAGRPDKALPLHKQALAKRQKKFGPNHPDTLQSMNDLAVAYKALGQPEKALPLLAAALAKRKAKLGPDHPLTLVTLSNLARVYQATGKLHEALRLYEQALPKIKVAWGLNHPFTLAILRDLALAHEQAGKFYPAERLWRELLARQRKQAGSESAATAAALAGLSLNLLKQHKYVEAEPLARECLVVCVKKLPGDWLAFSARSLLGEALLRRKKYAEAEPLLREGYQGMKQRQAKIPAPERPRLTEALERLVRLYEATGKKDEADAWRKQLAAAKAAKNGKP